jgi:hypothetical protein
MTKRIGCHRKRVQCIDTRNSLLIFSCVNSRGDADTGFITTPSCARHYITRASLNEELLPPLFFYERELYFLLSSTEIRR